MQWIKTIFDYEWPLSLWLSQGLKEMWETPEDVYQIGEVLNFYTGEGVGGQPKLSIFR